MTTPESILEADTALSDFINHARLAQRNPSYNRRRPHTHVIVPSRHPSRAKFRKKRSRSQASSSSPSVLSVLRIPVTLDRTLGSIKLESPIPDPPHQGQGGSEIVSEPSNSPSGKAIPPVDGIAGDVSPLTPKALTPRTWRHGQAAQSVSGVKKQPSIDNHFVEAIARNVAHDVAEKFQMLSIEEPSRSKYQDYEDSDEQPPEPRKGPSRTPSERKALDRFTRDLQRYAQHTGAKGKLPLVTPTSAASSATVRTISALLPFRPEFKAAGLAVTSNDQIKPHPHRTKASAIREARVPFPKSLERRAHANQLDGNEKVYSNNTEISFTSPSKMNEWRYAMMDEAAPRKPQAPPAHDTCKTKCLPCAPNSDNEAPERGCFGILPKSQSRPLGPESTLKSHHGPTSKVPKLAPRSSAPQWAQLASPNIVYPHHQHSNPHFNGKNVAGLSHQVNWGEAAAPSHAAPPQPQRATGLRRPSMVLP